MSVSVEVEHGLSPEGQRTLLDPVSKSSSESHSLQDGVEAGQGDKNDSEPGTPKLNPMAFTVDFGEGNKRFDNKRLEELAKKSQARHQRVQSMSASLTRSSPTTQKPPMSAKLPRKAQGYNSEGYFSSDQEDSGLSGSIKLKNSPLAQNLERTNSQNQLANRHIKSPVNDSCQPQKTSKSPIVDSIMSRSDNFVSRQGLILPLKGSNSSYLKEVHRTPSYGNISSSYQPKSVMADIIDKSPDGVLLTDISSPELDILTPDNGLSTPETAKSPVHRIRVMSETPDLFKKCTPKLETLYIDDDVDRESNSSTGTYTIEGDNYTEEQKARMSIDRTIASNICNESNTSSKGEKDPELIFDFQLQTPRAITKEPKIDKSMKNPIAMSPSKESKEKNILEISCCYESPNENDLAAQTSKQIKSTRSYLEKIKNRVRNITEKTFSKSPPKHPNDGDFGCFTSVTTSGVLSTKTPPKTELPSRRRCSLSKSEIDSTDYVHRLSRETSVPLYLPSNKVASLQNAQFESTAMKNAHKTLHEEKESPDDVEKLSHMSLNRCKGDKTWIQEWADSVKKYNSNTLAASDSYVIDSDRPPLSPRHISKPRSPHGVTASKIPSPVGTLLHRRTPDLIPTQDTETYLLKTQNAISNLQAKLNSSRTHHSNIPPQLTSSLISEKTAASRLPVSQLSRSNSLNYRLRRKEASADSSPLRSPGHYVITGSTKLPESTKILLTSASRSLDTDKRRDLNMNSPISDKEVVSNSSDDKTLSNRPQYDVDAILSPHRKTHTRHKSFDGKTTNDYFNDRSNVNQAVCLKTVLKNNAIDTKYRIEPTRCLDTKKSHQRVFSDGNKQFRPLHPSNSIAFGMSIKRSSSFNTVNRNNNYIEPQRVISRRSSGQSEECRTDYLSDDSDNVSYDKSQEMRYKKVYKSRIDSPDLKSISTAPANSPSRRCPHTPEMHRKFGPGLVRNSVRVTNKERAVNTRMSEPPISREERNKQNNHQSRKVTEPSRQSVFSRLTKSRSSTRETQPKTLEKGPKKPSQHRSSSALASKELEFSNWKKRSSYDPMKAAREGRKKQTAKRQDCKDDLSSPSHSSPVHRSQSFHTTNISELELLDYSSEDIEDDQLVSRLPMDPMLTSTQSCDVVFTRDYVAGFKVNQQPPKRHSDKRRTFILDNDITPTKENINFLSKCDDRRKTFILDTDTNSTTNGSSPARVSPRAASDTDDSDPHTHRHSGDYSMTSSTTSININKKHQKEVLPRYMDISKYKSESSPKNFLRRDPSKTYVGVLEKGISKGSAQHYEMEQKKQELEKWKRRASYDPRKQAALGNKPVKTASSVVSRSASFHGGVVDNRTMLYDGNSDNDF